MAARINGHPASISSGSPPPKCSKGRSPFDDSASGSDIVYMGQQSLATGSYQLQSPVAAAGRWDSAGRLGKYHAFPPSSSSPPFQQNRVGGFLRLTIKIGKIIFFYLKKMGGEAFGIVLLQALDMGKFCISKREVREKMHHKIFNLISFD